MFRFLLGSALLLLLVVPVWGGACLECHREKTPAAVRQWESSGHADKVGCAECHGGDHDAILAGNAPVSAAVCGRCHEQAFAEHAHSKHGQGLHSGWGCTRNLENRDPRECRFCHEEGSTLPITRVQCARFLKQSSEMGEVGCNRCHQVESSCASCHPNHLTELASVRDPGVCATCHMGPDHPQWEMWQTSRHGVLYASLGGEAGPTCQSCHMAQGSHDVSRGITATPAGTPLDEPLRGERREQMLEICTLCHGQEFARRDLIRADTVLSQSAGIVKQAEEVVWDLNDRGLLTPMPEERPAHPLRGNVLATDGQMLYEDTSHIERLLFKMKKYDFAKTWKGAYHQNPAYTHWYGNAELKMDLVDIRSEALRLQRPASSTIATEPKQDIEELLDILQKKYERGALSEKDYRREKERLLEKEFAPLTQ